MKTILILLFLILGRGLLVAAAPTDLGHEVVVVYNSKVPESKQVADYYALRRGVPKNQVIGLPLPNADSISRKDYRELLQRPLLRELEERKIFILNPERKGTGDKSTGAVSQVRESKIRYAALCFGIPLKIAPDPSIKEKNDLRKELQRNEAAVDSELALLPLSENLPLEGPVVNPFYGATNSLVFHPTNGILLVTRLDGPTAAIARGLVDKAIQAETNGLWGRAYFDIRSITNAGYLLGDQWIKGASEITRRFGFDTIVDENPATFSATYPMHHVAIYAGWYDDNVSGPFAQGGVDFMPGAIAYHLHSFSAATLRSTNRNWVGPLLARGATASLGSVDEPYLSGTPDINILVAHLFFFGCSFGEAAYMGQNSLSWQTTVVGDPLYRPFARKHQELHEDLLQRKHPNLQWSHLRVVNLNLVLKYPVVELIQYLERDPMVRESAVLAEKLSQLYEQQGNASTSLATLQSAASSETSFLHRLALQSRLAVKLTEAKEPKEALRVYKGLLKDFPAYFDKLVVYRQMLTLAQQAEDLDEIRELQKEINKLVPEAK